MSGNWIQRQPAFVPRNHSAERSLVKSPKIWECGWNFPPVTHSGVAARQRRREPWGDFFHQAEGFSGLVVFRPPRSSCHGRFYETLQLLFCDGTKKTEVIDGADSVSLTASEKTRLGRVGGPGQGGVNTALNFAIDGALTTSRMILCTRCIYMMLHA